MESKVRKEMVRCNPSTWWVQKLEILHRDVTSYPCLPLLSLLLPYQLVCIRSLGSSSHPSSIPMLFSMID